MQQGHLLIIYIIKYRFSGFRDEPLENLSGWRCVWVCVCVCVGGGGVRAKYKRKYSRKGKLNEKKIHARQLTLKNIHAMA